MPIYKLTSFLDLDLAEMHLFMLRNIVSTSYLFPLGGEGEYMVALWFQAALALPEASFSLSSTILLFLETWLLGLYIDYKTESEVTGAIVLP